MIEYLLASLITSAHLYGHTHPALTGYGGQGSVPVLCPRRHASPRTSDCTAARWRQPPVNCRRQRSRPAGGPDATAGAPRHVLRESPALGFCRRLNNLAIGLAPGGHQVQDSSDATINPNTSPR